MVEISLFVFMKKAIVGELGILLLSEIFVFISVG